MNRVLASFTSGERNIIVFVLLMVAGGGGLLEWRSARQNTMTFSAAPNREGAAEVSAPAAMPTGMDSNGLVDLNIADEKVLETLPGIGPSLAGSIVRHRSAHGPLTSMAELDNVPGIGPAMMAKLSPLVTFGANAPVVPVPAIPASATGDLPMAPGGPGPPATRSRININTAGPAELEKLKGVGPALAQRIIQYRLQHGPFRSLEALDLVKGIGPKILENNRELITIN